MYKEEEITLGMQLERKAEEKGRQEGIFLGESSMIIRMYNSQMKIENISSITGFPIEKIKEILRNNGLM